MTISAILSAIKKICTTLAAVGVSLVAAQTAGQIALSPRVFSAISLIAIVAGLVSRSVIPEPTPGPFPLRTSGGPGDRVALLLFVGLASLLCGGVAHAAASEPVAAPAPAPALQRVALATVGAGISAVSIRMSDGAIGLADHVAPAEVDLNLIQRPTATSRVVLWRLGLGLMLSRAAGGAVALGAYVIPWSLQIGSVAVGVGVGYQAVGNAGTGWSHVSLLLPCSYAVDLLGGGS